jgi:hypothetical protein
MFKRLRIAVLLYVLLFVAAGHYLTARRSTDWDSTLWVDVYPVNGDHRERTEEYLDRLDATELKGVEEFFTAEAERYGLELERPFRLNLGARYAGALPQLPATPSPLQTLWWSLRMRWLAAGLQWDSATPSADIVVFAVFHDAAETKMLDRSTALEKGLIAVANLYADGAARGSNQVVLAHELLHTLGATDKYEPGSNMPRFPEGYAAPQAEPRWPQSKAELMAGRIPLGHDHAAIPEALRQVVVGPLTAAEIGWLPTP